MLFYHWQNNVKGQVNSAFDAGTAQIRLQAASLPDMDPPDPAGSGVAVLTFADNLVAPTNIEVVTYSDRSADGLNWKITGVTRGTDSTSARSWGASTYYYQSLSRDPLKDQQSAIFSMVTQIDTVSASVRTVSSTLDAQVEALSSTLDAQVEFLSATLRSQIADNEADISTLFTNLSSLSATLDTQVETLSATLRGQIITLSSTLNTKINTDLSTLSANLDNDIRNTSANIAAMFPTLSATLNTNIRNTSATLDSQINSLDSSLSTDINSVNTTLSQAINDGLGSCIVGRSAVFTVTTTSGYNTVTCNVTEYDDESMADGVGITLPSDVTKVQVAFAVRFNEGTSGGRQATIAIDGDNTYRGAPFNRTYVDIGTETIVFLNGCSGPILVAGGEQVRLRVGQNTGRNVECNSDVWMSALILARD